jgi:hypothetical protein
MLIAACLALGAVPAAAEPPGLVGRIAAGRIVAISDGDVAASSYATGLLAPPEAGHRDLLTVLSVAGGRLLRGSLPVSNSVTAAPEILALAPDGRVAFVVERLGERPAAATRVAQLPPGRRLFAIDLADPAAPRLADTAAVEAFPEALSVSPDGTGIAVVSNTPDASLVQILAWHDGRFGTPARFDLAALGIAGSAPGPRGGVTATNIHWHPSGRFLAVNINTQNRVAFFAVTEAGGQPQLSLWGAPVAVGADPFVGRFTPDGRHYLTSDWGRDFAARDLEGRLPQTRSAISVIRLADPAAPGPVRHAVVGGAETDLSAEGLAISPDGRLVATVNMRGTALPATSAHFQREASVTLLRFDPASGAIARIADYPVEGALPEGGRFDLDGTHFLATVFEGHPGAGPEAGPGLEVFRVERQGAQPSLTRLGRIPLPHGVHHVDLAP